MCAETQGTSEILQNLYLVQSVARDIHNPRQRQAACVVIAANLSPLLQPSPEDVPPLHTIHMIPAQHQAAQSLDAASYHLRDRAWTAFTALATLTLPENRQGGHVSSMQLAWIRMRTSSSSSRLGA